MDPIAYEQCKAAVSEHLSFAIDDQWHSCFFFEQDQPNPLRSFIDTYYVPDEDHEQDLLGALRHGPYWPIYQFGRHGTGKTSIASKCLLEIAPEIEYLVIRIDCRMATSSSPQPNATKQEQILHMLSVLASAVRTKVLAFIDGDLGVCRRSIPQLAVRLLTQLPPGATDIPELVEARTQLLLQYDLSFGAPTATQRADPEFTRWLDDRIANRDTEVLRVISVLCSSASLKCLIAFLVLNAKDTPQRRLLIHVDNVEGLAALRYYPATREALRQLPNELGPYCQVLTSLRFASASDQLLMMALRPNPQAQKCHMFTLEGPLDVSENDDSITDDWDVIKRLAFGPNALTTQGLDRKSRDARQQRDQEIIIRRFRLAITDIQCILEQESGATEEAQKLMAVLHYSLQCSAYYEHMSGMANFDVRNMLMWVSNFAVETFFKDPALTSRLHDALTGTDSADGQGPVGTMDARSEVDPRILLDHTFYGFITSRENGEPRAFDHSLYCPASWAVGFLRTGSGIIALDRHFVLVGAYNLVGASDASVQKRVSVRSLVEICSALGLQEDGSLALIRELCVGAPHAGYLETFAGLVTQGGEDVMKEDALTILPRGREVVEALGRKYSYVVGCISDAGVSAHSCANLTPVPVFGAGELYEVMGVLARIADAEMDVLKRITSRRIGPNQKLDHGVLERVRQDVQWYERNFGVPPSRRTERAHDRGFLSIAMMDHVLGFVGGHIRDGIQIDMAALDLLRDMRKNVEARIEDLKSRDEDRVARSLYSASHSVYRSTEWVLLR